MNPLTPTTLPPFRLQPHFDPRVWGARCLKPWYDYRVTDKPIGEVWLTGDQCVAETGPLQGQTLDAITRAHSAEILGAKAASGTQFPLLMKVLFPNEKLSVQVHPDDAMAQKYGNPRGKTECWYALESTPEGAVALGFKPGVTLPQISESIKAQTLDSLLNWIPVKLGDAIFVDAGTVHAIGPGCVLLETQQNCDLTYRMYDYGRGRELHLDRAMEAMRLKTDAGKKPPVELDGVSVLMDARYFRVERFTIQPGIMPSLTTQHSGQPQILFVVSGAGEIRGTEEVTFEAVSLSRGQVAVVPATTNAWTIVAIEPMVLIRAIPQ
jgi:mannose-6-phosphate isomerase